MKETKFKQTEIGEVPEDWEVTTLGKLGKFSKGAGISREQSHSGTIPAIRYGEIYTTHHDYIKQFNSFISEAVAKTSRKLEYGDLLFSSSGETKEEIGKSVAFVSNFEAYAGGDIIIISPDTKKYYPKFWGFYLNSMPIVKQKALRGQGDAVVHIVSKDLASIIVAHPKREEQERIAEALSDVDGLLRELDAEIAKKRAIKQGAMQELLTGKRRLEGFGGEWEYHSFRDFYKYAAEGGTPNTSIKAYYENGKVPFVKIEDTTKKYIYSSKSYITEEGLKHASAWMVPADSIIFTNGATIGNVSINKIPVSTKQGILGIIPSDIIDLEFMYYLLSNSVFQKEVEAREAKGTFATVILPRLNEIISFIPKDKAEQTAIAKILSDMDTDIEVLEAKRAKYAAVKQGMMQELLTGKIRLV